jgi:hypothetical protein
VIIVDLDDFCDTNHSLELLCQIKDQIPQFKVTLFAIVGRSTPQFIGEMSKVKWVDLVPHGWYHDTSRECEHWTYRQMAELLDRATGRGFTTHGFKAPGWQISDSCYQVLLERDYWLADQAYNDHRAPKGLRRYLLDSSQKIHGHIGHWGGHNQNELSLIMPMILRQQGHEFGFVKDVV